MRTLTDEEKASVRLILESKWFKVIEWLLKEFQSDTMSKYILWNLDLENNKILKAFNEDKNYIKGAIAFIEKIRSAKWWVWKKN